MSLSTVRLHQLLVAAAFLVPCVVLVGAAWWNRAEVLREEDSAVVRTAAVMHEHASKVFDTAELAMDRVDDYVNERMRMGVSFSLTSEDEVRAMELLCELNKWPGNGAFATKALCARLSRTGMIAC